MNRLSFQAGWTTEGMHKSTLDREAINSVHVFLACENMFYFTFFYVQFQSIYFSHTLFPFCSFALPHLPIFSAVFSMQFYIELARRARENSPRLGDNTVFGVPSF